MLKSIWMSSSFISIALIIKTTSRIFTEYCSQEMISIILKAFVLLILIQGREQFKCRPGKNLKDSVKKMSGSYIKLLIIFFTRKYMNGGILKRTKVSMSSKEIPRFLWKNILDKQLQVTQEYFNKIK